MTGDADGMIALPADAIMSHRDLEEYRNFCFPQSGVHYYDENIPETPSAVVREDARDWLLENSIPFSVLVTTHETTFDLNEYVTVRAMMATSWIEVKNKTHASAFRLMFE